jgi:hypothetical protein
VSLEDLAAADERVQHHVGERPVLEEQRPQVVGVDGDVAHRLGDDPVHVDRLTGEQVHLPQEAARALPGDLVSGRVQDRRLALEDDDERVAGVADPEQELSLCCGALLAARREHLPLSGGEDGTERTFHPGEGIAGHSDQRPGRCDGSALRDARSHANQTQALQWQADVSGPGTNSVGLVALDGCPPDPKPVQL